MRAVVCQDMHLKAVITSASGHAQSFVAVPAAGHPAVNACQSEARTPAFYCSLPKTVTTLAITKGTLATPAPLRA